MNALGRFRELDTEHGLVLHSDPLGDRGYVWKVRAPVPAFPKKSPLCGRERSGGKPQRPGLAAEGQCHHTVCSTDGKALRDA